MEYFNEFFEKILEDEIYVCGLHYTWKNGKRDGKEIKCYGPYLDHKTASDVLKDLSIIRGVYYESLKITSIKKNYPTSLKRYIFSKNFDPKTSGINIHDIRK